MACRRRAEISGRIDDDQLLGHFGCTLSCRDDSAQRRWPVGGRNHDAERCHFSSLGRRIGLVYLSVPLRNDLLSRRLRAPGDRRRLRLEHFPDSTKQLGRSLLLDRKETAELETRQLDAAEAPHRSESEVG